MKAAARAAGIDATTAYARRRRHPRFAAQWADAAEAGRAGAAAWTAPKRATGAKQELILRSGPAGDQLVKTGAGRWNAKADAIFLATLALTGCVLRAADACGFSAEACHYRRRRYPAFAAKWEAALREAETRLPEMLTAAGIAGLDPTAAALGVPKADIDQAIAICRMRGLGMPASGSSGGAPLRRRRSIEEVRDAVMRQVRAIREQRGERSGTASIPPPSASADHPPPSSGEER